MGCQCLYCKHVAVVKDNHGTYHSICVCEESESFLKAISLLENCDHGEVESDEEETEDE